MDPTYLKSAEAILLPIFSSFAIILLVVPFIWHWRLKNIGACSLIFYISLANFFTFINAIIWPTEDFDSWWNGAGLCDIEVKLKWPCVTGLSCATLCITRNLANVLDVDRAELSPTRASKRRKVAIDLVICFTIPVLQIVLHYMIQVNRYYITAIGGCTPSYDNSWPTIVIMFMWPLIFCLINCYYAVAVIYRLHKYRSSFSAILSSSSSNLTTARFLRLFVMSFTLLALYTPVSIYFFYVNLDIEWLSYSWDAIHDPNYWWVIIYLPTQGVRTFDCWVSIAMAVFVFAYFGMGGDAIETYRKWMCKVGLGKLFPSMKHPRTQRVSSGKRSWTSQFSIISRAKYYFDSSRKSSNTTTLGTSIDQASTTHKPSTIMMEHMSHPKVDVSPLSRNAPYPSLERTSSFSHYSTANANTNIPAGKHINLPLQPAQALKADLTTHIWSAGGPPSQGRDIARIPTRARDGEVRVDSDVNRAISHDPKAAVVGPTYQ